MYISLAAGKSGGGPRAREVDRQTLTTTATRGTPRRRAERRSKLRIGLEKIQEPARSESDLAEPDSNPHVKEVAKAASSGMVTISSQVEAELAELPFEESRISKISWRQPSTPSPFSINFGVG